MSKKSTKFLALTMAGVAALSLAACGGGGAKSPVANDVSTLELVVWNAGGLKDMFLELERAFETKNPDIDVEKLKTASRIFIGEHDFKCFKASGGCSKTTVRTIYDIEVQENGEDIFIFVTGNGFLYNMVRILVGTLLSVAEGKLNEDDLYKMLLTGERKLGGKTLPAKGLCLEKVEY